MHNLYTRVRLTCETSFIFKNHFQNQRTLIIILNYHYPVIFQLYLEPNHQIIKALLIQGRLKRILGT